MDGFVGNLTMGSRMVGADDSTELWRHLNSQTFRIVFSFIAMVPMRTMNVLSQYPAILASPNKFLKQYRGFDIVSLNLTK